MCCLALSAHSLVPRWPFGGILHPGGELHCSHFFLPILHFSCCILAFFKQALQHVFWLKEDSVLLILAPMRAFKFLFWLTRTYFSLVLVKQRAFYHVLAPNWPFPHTLELILDSRRTLKCVLAPKGTFFEGILLPWVQFFVCVFGFHFGCYILAFQASTETCV